MSRSLRHGSRSPADLLGTEVFMLKQSRQQLKFQALLVGRAYFMRRNLTETESQLWRKLSGKQLGVAFKRQVRDGAIQALRILRALPCLGASRHVATVHDE
jgi:hypothetical protein